jgi:plastocyanin
MPHLSDVPNEKSKNEIKRAVVAPLRFLAELRRRPGHPTPKRAGIATGWSPRLADPYPQVAVGGSAALEVLGRRRRGISTAVDYARSCRGMLVTAAAVALVGATGCGSSSGGTSSPSVPSAGGISSALSSAVSSASSGVSSAAEGHVVEIDVAASGLSFVKSAASASAGPVVIRSKNPQSLGHDIAIRGNGVDEQGDVVSDGGVSMITLPDLKAGTYTFYCSVPGHEAAGMKGTLTVT